jgi:hypothetical protein
MLRQIPGPSVLSVNSLMTTAKTFDAIIFGLLPPDEVKELPQ